MTVDTNVQCYSVTAGKTKGCSSAELTARGSTLWSQEEKEEEQEELPSQGRTFRLGEANKHDSQYAVLPLMLVIDSDNSCLHDLSE